MTARFLTPIIRLQLRRSRCLRLAIRSRPLSSATDQPDKAPPPSSPSAVARSEAEARSEAYRQLQDLDFMTAAKILFTTPPKRKKFGEIYGLVIKKAEGVVSSVTAVYLVAQYARYEIRRMEAELEEKKTKAEEEQKAKEAELSKDEEVSEAELSKVKARLDTLEETVKEIADEKKKISSSKLSKDQQVDRKGQVASVDEKSGEHTTSSNKEKISGSGPSAYIAAADKERKGQAYDSGEAASGRSTT